MKKIAIILLVLLLGSTNSFASQLSLYSFWGLKKPLKTNGAQPGVVIYSTLVVLKNTGSSECVLPKANLGPVVIQESGKVSVCFSVPEETTMGDTKVRPSLCEFLPVKLRSGEALTIYYELILPAGQNIADVTFRYEIPSGVAKEWGFEEASLEAKLLKAP